MVDFETIFDKKPAIIPVISVGSSEEQIRSIQDNVNLIYSAGFDGVLLYDQPYNWPNFASPIRSAFTRLRLTYPDLWIGINWPSHLPKAFNYNSTVDGVMIEDIGFSDSESSRQVEAEAVRDHRMMSGWEGLLLGGVGFRQPKINGLHVAANYAASLVDVIVTGGERPGVPPSLEKVHALREAVGKKPLAITGVSPENIGQYMGLVDLFIVRSNLLLPETEKFDQKQVRKLARALRP